jgi:hypothetical protein
VAQALCLQLPQMLWSFPGVVTDVGDDYEVEDNEK